MNVLKPIIFMRKCLLFFFFFFYLYPVQFKYVPASTRIIMSFFGLAVLIFSIAKQASVSKDIFISKSLIRYLVAFGAIMLVSAVSITINGSVDFEFIKYPLSLVFILLAGYFLHFLTLKTFGKINYTIILNFIVAAVLVQVIISLISFLAPSFNEALLNIQSFNELDISKLEETSGFRLNGFGSTFFGAGIINGFALLGIAMLIKQKSNPKKNTGFLAFSFIAILALGAMMARTTLIGGIIGILFLLIPSSKLNRKIIKIKARFFAYLLVLPVVIILLVITLFPGFAKSIGTAATFGFEMFVNYSETGSFSTASTDALENMYVFPDNPKTYIIGDGHYYIKPGDPSSGYYKSTDVGYLRLIYYFGIIGLLVYILLQYTTVFNATKINTGNKTFRIYIVLVFILCLINNLKGFTDLFFLTNLFVFPVNNTTGKRIDENNKLITGAQP